MFTLLLVAVTASYPDPPGPASAPAPSTVTVDFGARGKVQVPAPAALPPFFWEATFRSPGGDAAALKFCQHVSVMGPPLCRVMLAQPGRAPFELRRGVVGKLLWTPDGQYLVGAGSNTVRLWNLAGGVRVVTPAGPPLPGQSRQADITRLTIRGSKLCVLVREDWYRPDASGRITRTVWSAFRYALPTLRQLDRQTVTRAAQPSACPKM